MKYNIQINPYNPVEYLACCGILEILAHFDAQAISWWELDEQSCCWLETKVGEVELLNCLKQTLTDWSAWQFSASQMSEAAVQDNEVDESDDADTVEEGNEGIMLSPSFYLNDQKAKLHLDWWYETLKPDKKIKEKSAWKMY